MSTRRVIGWIVIVLPALGFLMAGATKLLGLQATLLIGWGFPPWFAYVIGPLEIAGAIGLLVPRFSWYAACGLSLIMVGALGTHTASAEWLDLLRPVGFTAAIWLGWWLREGAAPDS